MEMNLSRVGRRRRRRRRKDEMRRRSLQK